MDVEQEQVEGPSSEQGDQGWRDAPDQINEKQTRRSALQRIGKWRSATLAVSFILSIVSLSYLGWLWNGNSENPTWVSIVNAQWVTRSATVAAIAVRTASSAQAVVATSMLATLLLETRGVRLKDAAEFSVLRCSNSGPLLNLQVFLQNSRGLRGGGYFALILFMTLLTTTLQFTSTIPLTDVRAGLLLGPFESRIQLSGMLSRGSITDVDYWSITPATMANFIEYSEPVTPQDNIADTGVSVRGFLPIGNETSRADLRFYQGMAALFDTRVVCFRPTVEFSKVGLELVDVSTPNTNFTQFEWLFHLEGRMHSNLVLPEFVQNATDSIIDFDCTFNSRDGASNVYICQLSFGVGQDQGLVSRLIPTNLAASTKNGVTIFPGHAYLLWDIPSACTTDSSAACGLYQVNMPTVQSGPWKSFTITNSSSDTEKLRVSLCYDALGDTISGDGIPHDYNVSLSSAMDLPPEPGFVYLNEGSYHVDTYALRKQLGATADAANFSAVERGVVPFDIKPVDAQRNTISFADIVPGPVNSYNTATTPFMWFNIWSPLINTNQGALALNFNTSVPLGTGVNVVLDAVFVDTLVETENPALALQAMWTVVLRNAYYDAVPFFDYSQETVTRMVREEQLPLSRNGLIAVATLIAVHIVLTMIVTAVFVLRGSLVVLHKAWAVIMEVWTLEDYALLGDDHQSGARISVDNHLDPSANGSERLVRLRLPGR